MTVTLAINTDDPEAARQLLAWLRRESDLRGAAELTLLPPPPAMGELGGTVDTVLAVLSDPAALSALTTTLGVWLGQRVRRTRIHVSDGKHAVEIETTSRRRAEEYAAVMLAKLQSKDEESG